MTITKPLTLYSTMSRKKETFKPIKEGKVGMYVCGVTVYDYCHIGHGRTFVAFDVIRRWLMERGNEVTFVRNVTDVDDKIIRRAADKRTDGFLYEGDAGRYGVSRLPSPDL